MKVITATEASRRFAAVLDEAEHGETIVVTRGGRRFAVIGPAPATTPAPPSSRCSAGTGRTPRGRTTCARCAARWTSGSPSGPPTDSRHRGAGPGRGRPGVDALVVDRR